MQTAYYMTACLRNCLLYLGITILNHKLHPYKIYPVLKYICPACTCNIKM